MADSRSELDAFIERRALLKGAALLGGAAFGAGVTAAEAQPVAPPTPDPTPPTVLEDIPAGRGTVTVERQGQIVLVGVDRQDKFNRFDPQTSQTLARTWYAYEHDPSLRCAVYFGHGPRFSRGIDVDAFAEVARAGRPLVTDPKAIELTARAGTKLFKPIIVVVHGDTWNAAHEQFLACDIRIAVRDVNFGQDENTHGRFPGGGATIRFPHEVGWGNAMRYMLTGDHWDAEEAYRMGELQHVADTHDAAMAKAKEWANKIAINGPLGIRTTLQSAHLAIDPGFAEALSKLDVQYRGLYATQDFIEGRKAEAEGRPPHYKGI